MCSLLSLRRDRRVGGIDNVMERMAYISLASSTLPTGGTSSRLGGSSHGVTAEIGVVGDSMLFLEATSSVAAPKIECNRA